MDGFKRGLVRDWWQRQPERVRRWVRAVGVLGFYSLAAAVAAWPVAARLSGSLAGFKDADQVQKVWAYWYTKEALLAGSNPAFFGTLVHPRGYFSPIRWASLTLHIALLPFELLLPPVAAYNVGFLLSYVLTGCAAYLLCGDITSDRRAGLFGGLVVMLFPTRVAQAIAGHVETANLSFALLYVLLLRRTLRKPALGRAALTGAALALAAMVHPTAPLYVLAPLTALPVLFHLSKAERGFFHRETWRALAVTFGVATLLLLPFYAPLVAFGLNPPEYAFEGGAGLAALSADLLAYITPSPGNPLLAALGLVPPFADDVLGFFLPEIIAYLGAVPLAFAGLAVARNVPESRGWLLIALVAMTLALGPYLKVGGVGIPFALEPQRPVPLPYALLARVPLFWLGRTPGRFNLVTGVCVGVLAAQGVAEWLKRSSGWRQWAVGVAAAAMACEYAVTWPVEVHPVVWPEPVEALAALEPEGGLLNVPASRYVSHYAQFYQTVHHWPIMGGYSGRVIPREPGVREMLGRLSEPQGEDIIPPVPAGSARALLAERGVAYVLLHKRFAADLAAHEAWLREVLGDPVAADEAVALYSVGPAAAPDGLAYALAGSGWSEVEQRGGEPVRWLGAEGRLVIYSPQRTSGELRFAAQANGTPRRLAVTLDDDDGEARAIQVGAAGEYRLPGLLLRAGYNVLRFEVQDTDCQPGEPPAACPDVLFWKVELR